MKWYQWIFTLGLVIATLGAWAAEPPTVFKPYHKGLETDCMACHGEVAPKEPRQFYCTNCHGSPEAVAEKTKRLGVRNPHDSLHWRTTLPCEECHKEHGEPQNYCTDACHSWPELKTK